MKMIYFEENRVSSHINFQARVQLATSFTFNCFHVDLKNTACL